MSSEGSAPRKASSGKGRQKAAAACDRCRKSKTRCDGGLPCSYCKDRGLGGQCTYSPRIRALRSNPKAQMANFVVGGGVGGPGQGQTQAPGADGAATSADDRQAVAASASRDASIKQFLSHINPQVCIVLDMHALKPNPESTEGVFLLYATLATTVRSGGYNLQAESLVSASRDMGSSLFDKFHPHVSIGFSLLSLYYVGIDNALSAHYATVGLSILENLPALPELEGAREFCAYRAIFGGLASKGTAPAIARLRQYADRASDMIDANSLTNVPALRAVYAGILVDLYRAVPPIAELFIEATVSADAVTEAVKQPQVADAALCERIVARIVHVDTILTQAQALFGPPHVVILRRIHLHALRLLLLHATDAPFLTINEAAGNVAILAANVGELANFAVPTPALSAIFTAEVARQRSLHIDLMPLMLLVHPVASVFPMADACVHHLDTVQPGLLAAVTTHSGSGSASTTPNATPTVTPSVTPSVTPTVSRMSSPARASFDMDDESSMSYDAREPSVLGQSSSSLARSSPASSSQHDEQQQQQQQQQDEPQIVVHRAPDAVAAVESSLAASYVSDRSEQFSLGTKNTAMPRQDGRSNLRLEEEDNPLLFRDPMMPLSSYGRGSADSLGSGGSGNSIAMQLQAVSDQPILLGIASGSASGSGSGSSGLGSGGLGGSGGFYGGLDPGGSSTNILYTALPKPELSREITPPSMYGVHDKIPRQLTPSALEGNPDKAPKQSRI